MYTQFYGNFLLNNNYVTVDNLRKALEESEKTALKLGVLAINSGYMNADQVEKVHNTQMSVNKRFGDIAVSFGYITESQVNELLSKQKPGYLSLGQALIDMNLISASDLEKSIKEYKETIFSNNSENENDDSAAINTFYKSKNRYITKYIDLLICNIIRFIGNDFIPLKPISFDKHTSKTAFIQKISGETDIMTGIEADNADLFKFATRFANDECSDDIEYAHAAITEFLNLQNGLFAVNLSNQDNLELKLHPQQTISDFVFYGTDSSMCIPFEFPFGRVNFIFQQV